MCLPCSPAAESRESTWASQEAGKVMCDWTIFWRTSLLPLNLEEEYRICRMKGMSELLFLEALLTDRASWTFAFMLFLKDTRTGITIYTVESFVLLSLNCCCSGLFLLYKWSAVTLQIKNCNKAPDLLEKSKFHSVRVYWFSSSQCKIMHLKLFCRAAHLCTPLPFSPTLLLGTESVKGFSSSNLLPQKRFLRKAMSCVVQRTENSPHGQTAGCYPWALLLSLWQVFCMIFSLC